MTLFAAKIGLGTGNGFTICRQCPYWSSRLKVNCRSAITSNVVMSLATRNMFQPPCCTSRYVSIKVRTESHPRTSCCRYQGTPPSGYPVWWHQTPIILLQKVKSSHEIIPAKFIKSTNNSLRSTRLQLLLASSFVIARTSCLPWWGP
jgi:hypothetical protein